MKNLLLSLLMLAGIYCSAQKNHTVIFSPFDATGNPARVMPTLVHLPKGYSNSQKFPLIVFLHGAGEGGNQNGSELSKIYANEGVGGPAYYIEQNLWPDKFVVDGVTYEPIVVSPQAPGWSANGDQVNYIIKHIVSKYNVDVDRIYVTGLSAGGEGTINYAARTNDNSTTNNPVPFNAFYRPAAIVPMSQAIASSQAKARITVNDNIPAWGFGSDPADTHGASEHRQMNFMEALKAGYGRYTNYNGGHCCWHNFYTPNYRENINGKNWNIYEWMLSKSRSGNPAPPPPPPVVNTAPVANAGQDVVITLPVALAALTGSASDKEGGTLTSEWTKIAGPGSSSIQSVTSLVTNVLSLVEGEYSFQLKVTDNGGLTAVDVVKVTVKPLIVVANPPTAPPPAIPTAPPPTTGAGYVVKVACTEYAAFWLYSDGNVYTYYYNAGTNKVEMTPFDLGGKKVKDVSIGFNIGTVIDQDGYAWVGNRANMVKPTRVGNDANGAVFNNNKSIYGYFYTYTTIREDGSIWYWGGDDYNLFAGTDAITAPRQLSPQGLKFKKVSMGKTIIGLTTDGQVYQWFKGGSLTPVRKSLPRGAIDIFGSHYDFFGCIIPDADGQTSGYPYVWGAHFENWGGSTAYNEPTSVKDLWKLNAPIKEIECNQNTIAFIDVNARLFTIGDNPNGELGIGSELVNHAETYPAPYNWDWARGKAMVGTPSHIATNKRFKKIFSSNTYAFYWWAVDEDNVAYHWGRTKSFVGGNGLQHTKENIYPNGLDILVPTPRNPVTNSPARSIDFEIYKLNAGVDQTIAQPTVNLAATGTATSTYTIAGWNWKQVSGPGQAVIQQPGSQNTTVSGLAPGVYEFSVQMVDNNTATITDNVKITVNQFSGSNQAPVANAGSDVVITLPINYASTDGSKSNDPDGSITSYQWTKIDGPSGFNWVSSNGAKGDVNNLVEGTYTLQLKVTDDKGSSSTDQVQVIVKAGQSVNQGPVANAGADKVVSLPVNWSDLDGTKSYDPDGSIVSYKWTKLSGPASFNFASTTNSQVHFNNLVQGTYTVELKVTDDKGLSSTDIVEVKVIPGTTVSNQAPVANAGKDIVVLLPVNWANLDGRSSYDPDGSIVSYEWTKIGGPSTFNLAYTTKDQAHFNNLGAGTYSIELKVTDSKGATSTDIVQVLVTLQSPPAAQSNKAPVANAGSAQQLNLPANTTRVDGSSSYDSDGRITQHRWSKLAGPSQYYITDANSAATNISELTEGVYLFRLSVTDDKGATGTNDVEITVKKVATQVQQPVSMPEVTKLTVNAGSDFNVTLPSYNAILHGSAINGTNISYRWTKVAGPKDYNLYSAYAAITELQDLRIGVYVFRLTATDNTGNTAYDDVVVTVTYSLARTDSPTALTATAWPNPSQGEFSLKLKSNSDSPITLKVYNQWGIVMKTMPEVKPNTSVTFGKELLKGQYFLQVKQGIQTRMIKLIKQ